MSEPGVTVVDPGRTPQWRAYLELTKPRIIELLLVTTVPAMAVAAGGWPGTALVVATVLGGTLSAAGANTINQVLDRDIDQVMSRTRRRPIPTGRVGTNQALAFGVLLGLSGFVWLWLTVNLAAAALSTAGLLFYVFVYTILLKRSSAQNIVIGGAAGAVPVLVGWAAVTGSLSVAAWVMFAIVFFWTPAHFWALALRYRDDYRRAGVPMLPVIVGEPDTADSILRYSVVTVGASLLLAGAAPMGWAYLAGAVVLGAVLVTRAAALRRSVRDAMRFFGLSNLYLAGVFLAMVLDALLAGPLPPAVRSLCVALGAVVVLGGGAAAAGRELIMPGRRIVGRWRDAVEVLLPPVGLVVLVVAAVASGAS